jgi:LmbE family N-acetylglucosaminyl deacetylase
LILVLVALVAATAAQVPPATGRGPVLILAPHPDDETLGCGGLIARRVHEGRRVVIAVLTDGRALLRRFGVASDPSEVEVSAMRKEETRRAVRILGGRVEDIRFLDFENERLVAERAEAQKRIAALLTELRPGEVYFPSPFEGHPEHIATNEMARAACAATGACPETYEFIVSLKGGVAPETLPRRVHKVDVSAHREVERRALAEFRSHLDVIYKGQPAPLTPNYDRYLTAEEPFLVER